MLTKRGQGQDADFETDLSSEKGEGGGSESPVIPKKPLLTARGKKGKER